MGERRKGDRQIILMDVPYFVLLKTHPPEPLILDHNSLTPPSLSSTLNVFNKETRAMR
jgi:hypothetical protein